MRYSLGGAAMGLYERTVLQSVVYELATRGGLDISPAAVGIMSDNELIDFIIAFYD